MGARNNYATRISLIGDSTILIISEFFAILAGLLSQAILTRGLSAEEYGGWIVVLDAFLTIFLLADPGVSTIIGRELPSNNSKSLQFMKSALVIQILFVFPILLILLVSSDVLSSALNFPIVPLFLICSGSIFMASSSVYRSFLRSTGRANWEATMRVMDRVILSFGYILAYINQGTIMHYSLAIAIAPSITLTGLISLSFIHARRMSSDEFSADKSLSPISLVRRSIPFVFYILCWNLLFRIDKFLLFIHVPTEDIATYGISLIVFFTGISITNVIRSILLPWLSEAGSEIGPVHVSRFQLSFLFVSVIVPIGVVVAQLVMMTIPIVIFPEEFTYPDHEKFSSESIFRILLIAWSMNLLISPSLESVRAYCRPSSINYCSIAGIFSAGLVGIVSVPIWGVYGAALIPLSAQLVFLLTGHIFMRNELKKEIGKEYFLLMSILVLYSFSPILFFFSPFTPLSGYLALIVLSLFSYLAVYRYWLKISPGMNHAEINFIL